MALKDINQPEGVEAIDLAQPRKKTFRTVTLKSLLASDVSGDTRVYLKSDVDELLQSIVGMRIDMKPAD